ncbi:MAG TPA: sigma-70 family RNA polymerase sigma factor [Deltaproteobacteria bacterium]|nr:sigma-70 family RNA polymerase sigma factor [Deltaproteobacteria bacterium]
MGVDIQTLYERYAPMIHRRCRALLRNDEEALEAMQDVFVEVCRRRDRLEVASPSSFLYRTATNVCLNRIRSRRRRPQDADTELVERIATSPVAEERSLINVFLDRVFARELPNTREMAVMHLVDGMTLEEVAGEVGLSVSGVRKRLRLLKAHVAELKEVA